MGLTKHPFIAGFLLCTVFASLTGCFNRDPLLAEVGRFKITQRDVELRDQVIRVYYPDERRSLGLEQLLAAYTSAAILEANGVAMSRQTLEQEDARIRKSSKMPEMLERIRKIFGDDLEAWLRVFVLPTYAQRIIYFDFFLRNPALHAESRARAEKLLNNSEKTAAFHEVDTELGGDGRWKVVRKKERETTRDPQLPDEGGKIQEAWLSQAADEENHRIRRWLDGMTEPEDAGEAWIVARKIRADVRRARFRVATIEKRPYSEWLEEQKRQIKITRFER